MEEDSNSNGKRGTKRTREKANLVQEDPDLDISNIDLDNIDDILDESVITKIVDQAPEVEALDSVGMKRMLVSFERALTKNRQLRIKYPRQPERFVDSEVDLDEEIKKLHVIATAPNLYPEFIQLKAHESVLGLLIHDNTDVTVDALDLIRELTDSDTFEENPDNVKALIDVTIDNQILELLVSNLYRLSETAPDEKSGVYNILSILENLLEVRLDQCDVLGDKTDILGWILNRIQVREFDEVKLYATEILSILLQNSPKNVVKIGKLNGIEIMLMTVARYKKSNPITTEEEELVENIFNCLCVTCPFEENKKYFTQAEGLKLLQIMIRNKRFTRKCALRLLDHVLARDINNCRRWVQLPALGTLFAAFMKKGSKKHRKGFSEAEDDEHIVSIIATLLRVFDATEHGKFWSRVIDKFRENDFAKVERLLELHEKYSVKVRNSDLRISQERARMERAGTDVEEEDEEDFYMQRLEAGLFTLQLVHFVIAVICQAQSQIKEKVQQLLTLQDSSFDDVKRVLLGYAQSLGGDGNAEGSDRERNKIVSLANDLTSITYQ